MMVAASLICCRSSNAPSTKMIRTDLSCSANGRTLGHISVMAPSLNNFMLDRGSWMNKIEEEVSSLSRRNLGACKAGGRGAMFLTDR